MIYFHKETKSPFKKQSEVFKDNDHVNQREAKEKSRVAANLGNHAEIGFLFLLKQNKAEIEFDLELNLN